MPSLRSLFLFALPLAGCVFANNNNNNNNNNPPSPTPTEDLLDAEQAWKDLIDALPEESLHAALQGHFPQFKEGIFERLQHGLERVHQDNAPLATRLIVAAVEDLKKRQGATPTNGTESQNQNTPTQASNPPTSRATSQAPPPSSNTPAPPASSTPQVIVSVPVTTTNGNGQKTVVQSAVTSAAPTVSVAVPVVTTNAQGQTVTSQQTKPAVVISTTDSKGQAVVTTSAVDFAPTPGQVVTSTDAKGSTFLTTYTPEGGQVSSVVLITTTDSNGKPSVLTSFAFVGGPQATGTDGKPIGTQTTKPGLQSGAANANRAKYWGVEAAVVGGVAAWLL